MIWVRKMALIDDVKKITKKQWKIILILSLLFYLLTAVIYHGRQVGLHYMLSLIKSEGISGIKKSASFFFSTIADMFGGIYGERRKLVFILLEVLTFTFVLGPKRFLGKLFEYRWMVALCVWVFCIVNQYHGDSLGAYNFFIQPGEGSEYVIPIYGDIPIIRSDEWAVSTPAKFSSSYGDNPYGLYNDVLRGGNTLNGISGIHVCATSLVKNVFAFLYPLLGARYGFCAEWWGQIILTFMVSIELFLIVSRRKRLPAFTGGCLVAFSAFYLWWGFPMVIWTSEAALVCFYYFIVTNSRFWRVMCGLGLVASFGMFCTIFYPAWQVPFGFVALALAVWIIHDNFEKIKSLKLLDYMIFLCSLFACGALLLMYFGENAEYLKSIAATVYPGHRESTGGELWEKLFLYIQAPYYAYKDIGITSEYGAFLSLFPMSFIAGILCFIGSIKDKKANWYLGGLIVLFIPFTLYVVTGLPLWLCKITLLTYSTATRMTDVIGYMGVLFIVGVLSVNREETKIICLPNIVYCIVGILSVAMAIFACGKLVPGYMSLAMCMASMVAALLLVFSISPCAGSRAKRVAMYGMIIISVITSIGIRPLMKGYDAVFSKPVAKKIQELVSENPDALWIGSDGSIVYQGFLAFLGAKTENTTNKYPDMEFWHKIDPDGEYEDIYNRYCHVHVDFTTDETYMELQTADSVDLYLGYKDIDLLGIEYIFSNCELNAENQDELTLIYSDDGAYIYSNIVD